MIKTLEKLGLSEKEAKVYLAALEMAQDTVQNIAKKAGVNRPTAYFILEKLMQLGLISTLEQGKKTLFVAESPKELEHLLEEQIQEIEHSKEDLKENMNQLLAIYNAKQGKPIVKYFEGVDGLEAMDRYGKNMLKRSSEIIGIAPVDVMEEQFANRRKSAINERVKLGVKSRLIYTRKDGEFSEDINKQQLREGILISGDEFPLNANITVYPEWGVKMFYYDPVHPYGVVIESKDLAKNMKILLELAWSGAKNLENK